MPTFPAFRQRLNQINQPFNAGVAETPMQFGMPMGGPSQNPMRRRRPMGENGAIPLVQPQQNPSNELPMSSGTGAAPAVTAGRSMVDKIKEKVASEVRYEDISPKMEEIPGTPAFNPKPVKGIGGRIKAAFQAAGAASQMNPGSPFAGLVGLAAGAVKPEIAQGLDYQHRVLPAAHKQQAEVMQRNDARQKSFGLELQNRERVAKINEANQPDYALDSNLEYPMFWNKKNPADTMPVKGIDGLPAKSGSRLTAEERDKYQRDALRDKLEHEAAINKEKLESAKIIKENDQKWKERFDKIQTENDKELERLRQSGRTAEGAANRGVRVSEGEKNRKSREGIADKRGSGRGRGSSEPVKPIERFPNIFQTPMNQNNFALPPRGNKLPTN